MPDWLDPGPLLFAWLIVAGVGALAAVGLRRLAPATPILPVQRRRATPWSGPHVFIAFTILYCVPFLILPSINPAGLMRWLGAPNAEEPVAKRMALAVASSIALPIQIAMWSTVDRLAGGIGPLFGIVPRRFAADFSAAYLIWLLLTPLVYVASFAATLLYFAREARPPEEHPILKLLQLNAHSIPIHALLVLQAVLIAPVGEEIFFRGVVQPYLTDRRWGGALGLALAALVGTAFHAAGRIAVGDPKTLVDAAAPALFVLAVVPLYLWSDSLVPLRWLPVHDPVARRQVARGIVGTAILFANVHANVWPTPVPLFVLALGLGWLAYRTQGVIAPIVLHMLFNAIPLFVFARPGG